MHSDLYYKRKAAIIDILKDNPALSNTAIGRLIGVDEKTIRRYKKDILNTKNIASLDDIREKRLSSILRKKCNALEKDLINKELELKQLVDISKTAKITDIKLTTYKDRAQREVVPVIVASDWHIEENVTAAITNGLNEYNLKIAEDSIKQFFDNAIYLVQRTKIDCVVKTVVFAILGDIINGVLRSEDLENNQITSAESVALARSYLYQGISSLAEATGCNVHVVCCVGNHGRLTEKIHYSNEIHNNLEYLIYKILEKDFKRNNKINFFVSEAPYCIKNIFGVRVRFHHGHCIKFNGGIGGIAVPCLRKIAQLNGIEKADLDVIGHWHNFQSLSNVIINGSLVGTNGYSMSKGLPHEPPQQAFFTIDSKYGKSMITPIFIDR